MNYYSKQTAREYEMKFLLVGPVRSTQKLEGPHREVRVQTEKP